MNFTQTDIATLATWFVQKGVQAAVAVFNGAVDIIWGGYTLTLGADSNVGTRTDATTKQAKVSAVHYTNAEEPIGVLIAASSATANSLYIGGGSGTVNSATLIGVYTGSTTTTTSGSRRLTVDDVGNVGIGLQVPVSKLDVHDTIGGILTLRRQDTSVTAGDMVGKLQFWAADTSTTTNFVVADIEAQAVSTVATDINPGRIIFRTTGTGVAATPTERLRIDEAGQLVIADGGNIVTNATTGTRIATQTGQKLGFWGAVPVARPAPYTVNFHTVDRDLTETTDTVAQVANVLGTLINDLKTIGLIG